MRRLGVFVFTIALALGVAGSGLARAQEMPEPPGDAPDPTAGAPEPSVPPSEDDFCAITQWLLDQAPPEAADLTAVLQDLHDTGCSGGTGGPEIPPDACGTIDQIESEARATPAPPEFYQGLDELRSLAECDGGDDDGGDGDGGDDDDGNGGSSSTTTTAPPTTTTQAPADAGTGGSGAEVLGNTSGQNAAPAAAGDGSLPRTGADLAAGLGLGLTALAGAVRRFLT